MDDLPLRIHHIGDVTVLTVGDHGPGEPLPLGTRLNEVLETEGPKLVIDLTGDEFVDSHTLGLMIRFHRLGLALDKRIRYCCQPKLLEVFGFTKLDRMMSFYTSLDDALRDF